MTVAEVAEERGLTKNTVWGHLHDIVDDDPEFDITHLQPNADIINAVEQAVATIQKRGNSDDFNQHNEVKLKPIFEELGEEVDYEDIKCALLFLE